MPADSGGTRGASRPGCPARPAWRPCAVLRLWLGGTRWAVFSGAAAAVYGSRRVPTDLDVLVEKGQLDGWAARLGAPVTEKVSELGRMRHAQWRGVDICDDVTPVVDGTPRPFFMDREMLRRRRLRLVGGLPAWVVAPEDVVVLKAILQRGRERGKFDVEDIRAVAARQRLDHAYLQRRAARCGATERVLALLQREGLG